MTLPINPLTNEKSDDATHTMRRRVESRSPTSSSSAPERSPTGKPYVPVMEHTRWPDHMVILFSLAPGIPLLVQLIFSLYNRFPTTKRLNQLDCPQIEAEILAAAVVALQCLQFIFCKERFRQNHWLVQWGAWAAYYAPLPLAAFAVGVMLRFRCPYWLVAIFFAAGQTDTMAAYSLDDDRHDARRFAKRTLMLAYLILVLLQGAPYERPLEIYYFLVLGFFVFFLDLKIRSMAMIPSSDICMVAAEAMRLRSQAPSSIQDATRPAVVAVGSLESRRTAVSGCITYQDILDLNYSSDLKDICLSSALFLQLLQRYNTSQVEVVNSSTMNNPVFKNLKADKSTKDVYARAFKIVEVQLSFLYHYFFSTHGSPSHTSYRLCQDYYIFKLAFLFSILNLVYLADKATAKPELVTSVYAIYALILLQLYQIVDYLTSNWLLVSFMCNRARNWQHTSWLLWIFDSLFIKAGFRQRSWQNELGQYALVEDFDRTSLKQRLLGRLLRWPHRGTPASPVALSDEIKRWTFDKAANLNPSWLTPLTQKLSWTWTKETEVRTILIWHIATWMCAKYEETMFHIGNGICLTEYEVATKLSKYCAYLLAFQPELLPGHHTVAASILDEAVKEAELSFKGETSPNERYKWMQDSSDQGMQDSTDQGILKLGVKLGRQLLDLKDTDTNNPFNHQRWEIMANFWIDMMLHVGQSGNVTAHIEHLAKGGEFLTHLWALLSNAGIQHSSPFATKQMDGSAKSEQAYRAIAIGAMGTGLTTAEKVANAASPVGAMRRLKEELAMRRLKEEHANAVAPAMRGGLTEAADEVVDAVNSVVFTTRLEEVAREQQALDALRLSSPGESFPGSGYRPENRKTWMEGLGPNNVRVHQVVWPGTHYSATNGIGILITRPFAQCQTLSVYEQLATGCRVLDVRVQEDRRVCHGLLTGYPVDVVLDDVKRFLAETSSEIIILEMRTEFGKDPAGFDQFLVDRLGDHLIRQDNQVFNKTIAELLPRRVICVWKPRQSPAPSHGGLLWSKDYLRDDWIDTDLPKTKFYGNLSSLSRQPPVSRRDYFYRVENTVVTAKGDNMFAPFFISQVTIVEQVTMRIHRFARLFISQVFAKGHGDKLQVLSTDFIDEDFVDACVGVTWSRLDAARGS